MTDDLRSEVLDRISQRDWLSDERRQYLERLGTLTAGSKIRVQFLDIPTASCGFKEQRGYHEINMRSRQLNMSNLPPTIKDLGGPMIHTLLQEGFLYHELGHVLMSDYDAWEDVVKAQGSLKRKKMFKQFLNATEDVVIEAWLRRKYDCGKILDFKNELKFRGITGVPETKTFEFYDDNINDGFSFVLNLIESIGRYNGKFLEWAKLDSQEPMMDRYEQPIRDMVSQAVREPRAQSRYEIIRDTFDEIYDGFAHNNPADENEFSPENQMGGGQQMQIEVIPVPEDEDEDDKEGEGDGSGGEDSGNTSEEQDGNGGGGSSVNREARPVEEILNGRDPEEVKVVM